MIATAHDRAMTALRRHADSPRSDQDGTIAATMLALGSADDPRIGLLLDRYLSHEVHYGRDNAFRYPWPISTLGEAGDPTYDIGVRRTWWRPLESEFREQHRRAYARRLALAPILASQLELWSRVSHAGGPNSQRAASLLAQVTPTVEHDVARAIVAIDPWADTFLLWQLTDRPGAFELVRGLLFALGIRYGTIAQRSGGIVHGIRHPFYEVPLASGTAQLAMGLWRFGLYPSLLPDQLRFLRSTARDGAWADATQPPDVLTTLAVADVLARLDPAFDPTPTGHFFARHQEAEGWWRALDPEVPWLTAAIVDWMRRTELSFARRFEWPTVALWQRDYITGLPTMAFFAGVADALERIGGSLGSAPLEAAFCDLAGFRDFNTTYGQALGDGALRAFGDVLSETGHLVVRIGGDELLIIGQPTEQGALEPSLRAFVDRWPAELARRLPVAPDSVRPRIILDRGTAGDLRGLHAALGQTIGELKEVTPEVRGNGVLIWR